LCKLKMRPPVVLKIRGVTTFQVENVLVPYACEFRHFLCFSSIIFTLDCKSIVHNWASLF
jgi:hypothetical protein